MVKPRTFFFSKPLLLVNSEAYCTTYPHEIDQITQERTGVLDYSGATHRFSFFVSSVEFDSYIFEHSGKGLQSLQKPEKYALEGTDHISKERYLIRQSTNFTANYDGLLHTTGGRIIAYDKDSECIWKLRCIHKVSILKQDYTMLLASVLEIHFFHSSRLKGYKERAHILSGEYWLETLRKIFSGTVNWLSSLDSGGDNFLWNTCMMLSTKLVKICNWDAYCYCSNITSSLVCSMTMDICGQTAEVKAYDRFIWRYESPYVNKNCRENAMDNDTIVPNYTANIQNLLWEVCNAILWLVRCSNYFEGLKCMFMESEQKFEGDKVKETVMIEETDISDEFAEFDLSLANLRKFEQRITSN